MEPTNPNIEEQQLESEEIIIPAITEPEKTPQINFDSQSIKNMRAKALNLPTNREAWLQHQSEWGEARERTVRDLKRKHLLKGLAAGTGVLLVGAGLAAGGVLTPIAFSILVAAAGYKQIQKITGKKARQEAKNIAEWTEVRKYELRLEYANRTDPNGFFEGEQLHVPGYQKIESGVHKNNIATKDLKLISGVDTLNSEAKDIIYDGGDQPPREPMALNELTKKITDKRGKITQSAPSNIPKPKSP